MERIRVSGKIFHFRIRKLTSIKASKCAVRGLADTLRMEAIRLSNATSRYTVHCAFPSNFISPAFVAEQERKPQLTKQLEGTMHSMEELSHRLVSIEKLALGIVEGVESGDFVLCNKSPESALLFANMVGPSPRRGLGVIDSILSVLIGLFAWPITRKRWERKCERDGALSWQSDV